MTTLTKKDREHALESILTDAFKKRFANLFRLIESDARAHFGKEYPAFYRAWADADIRPHLSYSHPAPEVERQGGQRAVEPIYGQIGGTECPLGRYPDRQTYRYVDLGVTCPTTRPWYVLSTERAVEYAELWGAYHEAAHRIYSVLHAYRNREKFVTDFPDFAPHLPPPPVTALPVVVPKDVMKALRKLGVPPKGERNG